MDRVAADVDHRGSLTPVVSQIGGLLSHRENRRTRGIGECHTYTSAAPSSRFLLGPGALGPVFAQPSRLFNRAPNVRTSNAARDVAPSISGGPPAGPPELFPRLARAPDVLAPRRSCVVISTHPPGGLPRP